MPVIERLPAPVTICADCRAEIVFARTIASERGPGGKAMPLDVVPNPAGNVAVNIETPGHLRARVLAKDETMPHFATCTRRKRGGSDG